MSVTFTSVFCFAVPAVSEGSEQRALSHPSAHLQECPPSCRCATSGQPLLGLPSIGFASPEKQGSKSSLFRKLVVQSCLTLCNPMGCGPPGSSVHGSLQARILEWVAISSSRGIFPTQGSNPRLLHWQADSLLLSHLGSPVQCCVLLSCSAVSDSLQPRGL